MRAILLLDDISRDKIKSNISVLLRNGISIVNTMDEITDSMLSATKTVFVLEGYLLQKASIASLRFYAATLNLEYIFLMQKQPWHFLLKDIGRVYNTDVSDLSMEILQAALYNDHALENEVVSTVEKETFALANQILNRREQYSATECKLANALLAVNDRESEIIYRNEQASLLCEPLIYENQSLKNRNQKYLEQYTDIFAKAIQLNSALAQYESIFTRDVYTKVDLNTHNDRPAIVYIKECEWLQGFDQLIETLYNAFRIQSKKSVKVLRLFDSSSSRRLQTLPKYYTVIKNRYKMSDMDTANFLVKTGDYYRILDNLLLNRLHLDVLIIIDSKDHSDTVLSGSYIIYNVCGRKSSLLPLHLSAQNTITNDDTPLHWENFVTSDLTSSEAFTFLSNQGVIGEILQSITQFEGVY